MTTKKFLAFCTAFSLIPLFGAEEPTPPGAPRIGRSRVAGRTSRHSSASRSPSRARSIASARSASPSPRRTARSTIAHVAGRTAAAALRQRSRSRALSPTRPQFGGGKFWRGGPGFMVNTDPEALMAGVVATFSPQYFALTAGPSASSGGGGAAGSARSCQAGAGSFPLRAQHPIAEFMDTRSLTALRHACGPLLATLPSPYSSRWRGDANTNRFEMDHTTHYAEMYDLDGRLVRRIGLLPWLRNICLSPDGSKLAGFVENRLEVYHNLNAPGGPERLYSYVQWGKHIKIMMVANDGRTVIGTDTGAYGDESSRPHNSYIWRFDASGSCRQQDIRGEVHSVTRDGHFVIRDGRNAHRFMYGYSPDGTLILKHFHKPTDIHDYPAYKFYPNLNIYFAHKLCHWSEDPFTLKILGYPTQTDIPLERTGCPLRRPICEIRLPLPSGWAQQTLRYKFMPTSNGMIIAIRGRTNTDNPFAEPNAQDECLIFEVTPEGTRLLHHSARA